MSYAQNLNHSGYHIMPTILSRPQTFNYASPLESYSDDGWRQAQTMPDAMRVTFNGISGNAPPRAQAVIPMKQWTQKQQDDADEEARKKAVNDLVQSWSDRLQLISLITTFFASVEASLLQITTPKSPPGAPPIGVVQTITDAALVSALIMHSFAAIVSFLASFVLIKYRIKEAKKEEIKAEGGQVIESPVDQAHDKEKVGESAASKKSARAFYAESIEPPIISANPHIVRVGFFSRPPPTNLLSRCHNLCVFITAFGFVLAIVGIVCLAWALMPLGASIFASSTVAFCIFATAFYILR